MTSIAHEGFRVRVALEEVKAMNQEEIFSVEQSNGHAAEADVTAKPPRRTAKHLLAVNAELVEANKEQAAHIDALEAAIARLKGQLDRAENRIDTLLAKA